MQEGLAEVAAVAVRALRVEGCSVGEGGQDVEGCTDGEGDEDDGDGDLRRKSHCPWVGECRMCSGVGEGRRWEYHYFLLDAGQAQLGLSHLRWKGVSACCVCCACACKSGGRGSTWLDSAADAVWLKLLECKIGRSKT